MPSGLRWPTPAALSNTTTLGAMPMRSKIHSKPWHTHSEVSPGRATTQRMFEYGNDATRKCATRSTPATRAPARPKSTCMLPGAHSNSAKPSDSMRCSSRQRLTQRCTDENTSP